MPIVFSVVGVADLVAVALHLPVLEWACKPLLAPLLAVYLWRSTGARHRYVLAGLLFATAGDIALLDQGQVAFGVGMLCFLGMQIAYVAAFRDAGAFGMLRDRWWLPAAYLAGWAVANAALGPSLGVVLGTAVAVYSLALVAMAATAPVMGAAAGWGGALFVVSDLLIGVGAAGGGFSGRAVLVMSTYLVAQALIVTGVARSGSAGGVARSGSPAVVSSPPGRTGL